MNTTKHISSGQLKSRPLVQIDPDRKSSVATPGEGNAVVTIDVNPIDDVNNVVEDDLNDAFEDVVELSNEPIEIPRVIVESNVDQNAPMELIDVLSATLVCVKACAMAWKAWKFATHVSRWIHKRDRAEHVRAINKRPIDRRRRARSNPRRRK